MAAILGTSNGGFDIEGLVAQFRAIELIARGSLEIKKEKLESRQEALSDLDSKFSALFKLSERLADPFLNVFGAKLGSTSNADLLSVTAGSTAQVGSHSLTVDRLASIDTRVSQQYSASGTDFTALSTDQTFKILVAHPTDADPDNRVEISVTVAASAFIVDSVNQTNDDVLSDIAKAINNAMSAAVTAGDIEITERVTASSVAEESGTSRLVVRSGQSGETHALEFDDVDGLLGILQVTKNVQTNGTKGGFITALNELSAAFTIDGLTFSRDSNFVDDALEGVTLQLAGTTTTKETFTISSNVEAVQGELQEFIDAFNEAIEFLTEKSKAGGEFRGDTAFGFLQFNLRSLVTKRVTGALSTEFDQLSEIGISINRDGTLFFEDATKLEAALAKNSNLVSELFGAADGIGEGLQSFIVKFTRASGLISGSQRIIDRSLIFQDTRLDEFDERLLRKEDRFRDELIRLQVGLAQAQQQAAAFNAFSAGFLRF